MKQLRKRYEAAKIWSSGVAPADVSWVATLLRWRMGGGPLRNRWPLKGGKCDCELRVGDVGDVEARVWWLGLVEILAMSVT